MNIRPFTDRLRKAYPGAFVQEYDWSRGGGRTVQFSALFHEGEPAAANAPRYAIAGDRWVSIQLSDDGKHRANHGLATRDGPVSREGPPFYRATTYPTYFATPDEMVEAIKIELARMDHKP